jgi:hypothetical protein
MSILLPLLEAHTPPFVRPLVLALLFRSTAAAFGCPAPRLRAQPYDERLCRYALFTAAEAEKVNQGGSDPSTCAARLYEQAYRLGRVSGRLLGIRTIEETMTAGRMLYSTLEIDFQGDAHGQVRIPSCYFSSYYSPQVCRLMSAMDQGLFAGLSGGGLLVFKTRISEGYDYCQAQFTAREQIR